MISDYVLNKYISMCNLPSLVKQDYKWNFRCVICGDSKTKKNKRRGFILYDPTRFKTPVYSCRNCGVSISFSSFLYKYRQSLYNDYKREITEGDLFQNNTTKVEQIIQPVTKMDFDSYRLLRSLPKISENEMAQNYCKKRKLPEKFVNELYYIDNFIKYVHDNNLMKFESIPEKDERIIIPVYDKEKNLTFIQGRALYKTDLKYITISVTNSFKIWGMDRITYSKPVYCFEGVFDAVFIPNSLSTLGAQFNVKEVKQYANVYCPDFDIYTNTHVKDKCIEWVNAGGDIFIPPQGLHDIKDVNDMIMKGVEPSTILDLIQKNCYNSLSAITRLKMMGAWK